MELKEDYFWYFITFLIFLYCIYNNEETRL